MFGHASSEGFTRELRGIYGFMKLWRRKGSLGRGKKGRGAHRFEKREEEEALLLLLLHPSISTKAAAFPLSPLLLYDLPVADPFLFRPCNPFSLACTLCSVLTFGAASVCTCCCCCRRWPWHDWWWWWRWDPFLSSCPYPPPLASSALSPSPPPPSEEKKGEPRTQQHVRSLITEEGK